MADDLEKYLSDLGIDTEGEGHAPPAPRAELPGLPDPPREDEPEVVTTYTLTTPVSGDHIERCESFLAGLLLKLSPDYAAEVRDVEGGLYVDIHGGDAGKLIGRGGRTLAALEYLTNAVVNKDESVPHVRVSVDVGGYKERRDERLRGVALKAAARARKTGFAVELEAMSAAERRVIHMALADDPAVESESSGEGKDRRVVVKPR